MYKDNVIFSVDFDGILPFEKWSISDPSLEEYKHESERDYIHKGLSQIQ